jgi:hypothetical protein
MTERKFYAEYRRQSRDRDIESHEAPQPRFSNRTARCDSMPI